MTATNHYLTGVAIAAVVKNPLVALPAALLSHYILDVLPHFGSKEFRTRKKFWHTVWKVDAILLAIALMATLLLAPWWFVVAGFVATSPDLAWVYRFIFKEKWGRVSPGPMGVLNRFHAHIQWGERYWGVWVELGYLGVISSLLLIQ